MRLHETIQMRRLWKSRNLMDRLRNRVNSPIRKQFLFTYKLSLNRVLAVFKILTSRVFVSKLDAILKIHTIFHRSPFLRRTSCVY